MRRLALAAFVLATTSSSIALANPLEEGRAHFQKGVALYRTGDFRAALAEFRAANEAAPSFRIQFNIGQTCAELHDDVCALRAFEKYLAEGGTTGTTQQRTTAEREIERLRANVGSVRVAVNVAGAEVAVDDVAVGLAPLAQPIDVMVGAHKITAKKDAATATMNVDVAAKETADVALVLAPPKADKPVAAPEPANNTAIWIGIAATSVLATATVACGIVTLNAKSDLDDTANRFGVAQGEIDDARSKVDTFAIVTDVFFGATLIAAGVTAYLFLKSPSRVGVGPGGFRVILDK